VANLFCHLADDIWHAYHEHTYNKRTEHERAYSGSDRSSDISAVGYSVFTAVKTTTRSTLWTAFEHANHECSNNERAYNECAYECTYYERTYDEQALTPPNVNGIPNTYSHRYAHWTTYLAATFVGPVRFPERGAIDCPVIINSQLGAQLTTLWPALCPADQYAFCDSNFNAHFTFLCL
jgi:hypothetical protein